MKIGFIIPNYKTFQLAEICLISFQKFHENYKIGIDYELILVDDNSPNREAHRQTLKKFVSFYNVNIIEREKNGGFAKTVNNGIWLANGLNCDIYCLVNSDIIFIKDVIKPILKAFRRDPKIGIVGGFLLYPDKTVQHGGAEQCAKGVFTHEDWHREIPFSPKAVNNHYAIAVTGALYAISKELKNKIGLLPEKYFIAFEDTDYCLNAWKNGFRVFYSKKLKAIHAEGATRGRTPHEKLLKEPEKMKLEYEAQKTFAIEFEKHNMDKYYKEIHDLNSELGYYDKRLKYLNENKGVLGIKRLGARGDVLLLTGIIRYINKRYPYLDINIHTNCLDVFVNNPLVNVVTDREQIFRHDLFIDLDLAYEKRPHENILDAYCNEIFGHTIPHEEIRPEIYTQEQDSYLALSLKNTFPEKKKIILHMGRSWENRTYPQSKWDSLIRMLDKDGHIVIIVGAGNDLRPKKVGNRFFDLRGKTTLQDLKEVIKMADLVVCIDSLILHIAQCTDTPFIGIFTCVNPSHRIVKHEDYSNKFVCSDHDCRFCLHFRKAPVTFAKCNQTGKRKHECINNISPSMIYNKIKVVLDANNK